MPIIYAVVARGPRVLCEYALSSGNFATIARKILEKLPEQREDRHSYEYDEHVFHVLVDGDLVFMCMCDHDFGRVLPFHFLNEVRKRWLNHGSEQLTVSFGSPGGNGFENVLRDQMNKFSGREGDADVEQMQNQLGQIKSVMVDNIEKVLDRGEKINLLVDKTDNLHQQAFKFSKASTHFKRQMWWRNVKMMLMLGGAAVLLLYLIGSTFCGGLTLPTCRAKASTD